jgi:NAD(P)-dependent dehydrogenase (short-subunit alcohol dehydrogenase family)
VLVIGGSSGIGAATAAAFAGTGAHVVITGRDEAKLAKAADDMPGQVGVGAQRLDATSASEIAAFFAAETRYDHLVLCAGGGLGMGPFGSLDLTELRAGFEAKFWAHVQVLQAALPRLDRTGSVTFITAASARAALPGTAGLAAINGALDAMVPPLAAELAPLRVNAISPGVVDTPWWSRLPEDARRDLFTEFAGKLPVGRIGTAADIAHAVLFAATNGYLTGTVIDCTGGGHLATG